MIPAGIEIETFGIASVASLAGVATPTIRSWLRKKMLRASGTDPEHRGRQLVFTFADVTIAALIAGLARQGVSAGTIKRATGLLYGAPFNPARDVLVITFGVAKLMGRDEARKLMDRSVPVIVCDLMRNAAAIRQFIDGWRTKADAAANN